MRSQGAEYHQAARALLRGDIEKTGLSPSDRALLAYAEKLTKEPAAMTDADVEALRAHGFDDAQVWEATFQTAIFNLYTRMADAFGLFPPKSWTSAFERDEPRSPGQTDVEE